MNRAYTYLGYVCYRSCRICGGQKEAQLSPQMLTDKLSQWKEIAVIAVLGETKILFGCQIFTGSIIVREISFARRFMI